MIETDACEDVTAADAQRQTKQNHYFDASEHGPGAAEVARGQRSGSGGLYSSLFYSDRLNATK